MTDEELQQASQMILTVLRFCSPRQRETLFTAFNQYYCLDCGESQGRYRCQCTNDD